jgi:Mg2+ and Co2+ transporter CorA
VNNVKQEVRELNDLCRKSQDKQAELITENHELREKVTYLLELLHEQQATYRDCAEFASRKSLEADGLRAVLKVNHN